MRKLVIMAITILLLSSGCTSPQPASSLPVSSSTIVPSSISETSPSQTEPDDTSPLYTLDWDQLGADWKDDLMASESLFFIQDAYAGLRDDGSSISMLAIVSDSTDPAVALDLADTMIRRYNTFAQMQDNSIAGPTNDYYGGLFDEYSLIIGVAPASTSDDTDTWYVSHVITKGMHTRQAPELQ